MIDNLDKKIIELLKKDSRCPFVEIANQLGIRKDGVEDHINVIFQKLGASNRAEAVAIAMRKQLLKM